MAFNSKQCVLCTEPTKRSEGKYHGEDENGRYSGPMYICDSPNCSVNYERRKLQKQVIPLEVNKKRRKIKRNDR